MANKTGDFTQGPFKVSRLTDVSGHTRYVIMAGPQAIAYIYGTSSETKANANLLATSFELLEVLMSRHPFEICKTRDCDACAVIIKAGGKI